MRFLKDKSVFPFHYEFEKIRAVKPGIKLCEEEKVFLHKYHQELTDEYELHIQLCQERIVNLGGDEKIHMPETEINPPTPFL